ncbi:SOS response-associated peptidase family protein [Ralstonia pseudosolanacearum]|uniref:SOS response-associated peptidase family protein n=1 Tax=Ralstonia pseudosolanacearum TaxID=1310165 RepID=UPI003CFB3D07
MCTNYTPTQSLRLREILGLGPPADYPPETYPDYDSPLILIHQDGGTECIVANFGFAPEGYARPGMPNPVNARAETVGTNRMFAPYWKACNLCIVPVDAIYEPCYESGRNVRHKIWIKGVSEFGVAGIWRAWPSKNGGPPRHTFAMLTLNADDHAIFQRMHKPTNPDGTPKEKRGVVMLTRDRWADWLACKDPEVARTFLRLYPSELMDCAPAPAPARTSAKPKPPEPDATRDLF